jgi:hypothetical protein
MIVDAILLLVQGVLNVLLAPLTIINIVVDFVAGIPVVGSFINVVAYVLPWAKLLPLITLIVGIFTLRIGIALVRLIKGFIPTMST